MASRSPWSADQQSHPRKYDRFPVHGSIYFSSDEGDGTGTLCNVSLGGWRVSSEAHVKPGESVTFFATLPDQKQAVLVDQAKVCWSRGSEFGLAIRKITPEDAERLKVFISARSSQIDA
jgi:hypothetical protein